VAPKRNLFGNEWDMLEASRKTVENPAYHDNELLPEFKELVAEYEKLIKLTTKIFKISDIQGKNIKQHQDEMREMNDNLQQLEDSRRQLMSDISHELGTPMTSIQGYVKAMLDGVIEPGEPHLRMIYNKVLLVNSLVDDLFELSKLESNKADFHFMDYTLEQLLELLRDKFELEVMDRGYDFTMEHFESSLADIRHITISIDPFRIEQVMNNFVYNAFKYTSPGGVVKIHGEIQIVDRETAVNKGAKELPCEVIFKVTDSGQGIDEASLPYVFDRFYRANKTKSSTVTGTGLGLAIAKEIVLQHQGQIGVNSVKGQGCTFYFTLPGIMNTEQTLET
jgi:signal transduction histidine kinase